MSLPRRADPDRTSRPRAPTTTFVQFTGTATGPLLGVQATVVASAVRHDIGARLNRDTEGGNTALFDDERRYGLATQEVRLAGDRWFAGVSRLSAQNRRRAGTASDFAKPQLSSDEATTEVALFGEWSVPLTSNWMLTAGARVYRIAIDDELLEDIASVSRRRRKTGVSPSLALAWRPDGGGIVFARAAHALRAGALNPDANARPVNDDSVRVVEVGARVPVTESLFATANASFTDWRDVQSDVLTGQGLVATRNVGRARIPSLSLTADWRQGGWFATGAVLLQRPRLNQAPEGSDEADLRLPVVPDMAATVRGGWRGGGHQLGVAARVTGSSRLSFDPALNREIGELLDVAAFASTTIGSWTVAARLDNLLDGRSDRLGYGNSFTLLNRPQYVPQVPRSLSLSVSRSFGTASVP